MNYISWLKWRLLVVLHPLMHVIEVLYIARVEIEFENMLDR